MITNPLKMNGIAFIEFTSPEPEKLHRLFLEFGFSRTMTNSIRKTDLYTQGKIRFLLNRDEHSFARKFSTRHGPSICSMGWNVADEKDAFKAAVERGARPAYSGDYRFSATDEVPAIYGIGDSLIYFVKTDRGDNLFRDMGFTALEKPDRVPEKGFLAIDHLTNNVENGTLQRWASFYRDVFGFTEVRYFDIRGAQTGLQSYALRSPCGTFCIPINEAKEEKSQINEYLREYQGPGIQHLAFLTENILSSVAAFEGTSISTLDIEDNYYDTIYDRVPNVTEDHEALRRQKILIDGDDEGYLLQVFTKNLIGPIFMEIIQRKNHLSFGEGNFGALFRSIERDQEKRGVFKVGA